MASLSNFDQRKTFLTLEPTKSYNPLTSLRAENCAFVLPDIIHTPRTGLSLGFGEVATISGSDVVAAVCQVFEVSKADLIGPRRARYIARPRQVAMYFCRRVCSHMSLPMIGAMLGGRDHTTIMHGCRQIEALLTLDPWLRNKCRMVSVMLGEGEA